MRFDILPLEGVGPLAYGDSQRAVVEKLGLSPEPFGRGGGPRSDQLFSELGVFCYYDNDMLLEAVEFAREVAEPIFIGKNLFDFDLSGATAYLTAFDSDLIRHHEGLTSERLGIRLWCPFAKEEERAEIESVLTCSRTY